MILDSKKIRVRSKNKQKYLENYGILPQNIVGCYAYYEHTPQITKLLDRYDIRYVCIPNKL